MFEASDTITEYVNALVAACEPLKRGEFLTHDVVGAILGVAPHQGHWQTCVIKLKRRLEDERGISLWPEYGTGYRLLTTDEQLTVLPRLRLRRAHRQIRRAKRSVEALAGSKLSVHQRHIKARQLEALGSARHELAVQARQQAALMRPTETLPRPARNEPQPEATAATASL